MFFSSFPIATRPCHHINKNPDSSIPFTKLTIKSHHLNAPEPKTSEFLALPQKQTARPSKVMLGRRPFPFERAPYSGVCSPIVWCHCPLIRPYETLSFWFGEYLSSFLPDVGLNNAHQFLVADPRHRCCDLNHSSAQDIPPTMCCRCWTLIQCLDRRIPNASS